MYVPGFHLMYPVEENCYASFEIAPVSRSDHSSLCRLDLLQLASVD